MVKFEETRFNKKLDSVRREQEEELVKQLALQYGLPYVNLRGYTINPEAIQFISKAEASDAEIIPFDTDFKSLSVAIRNPNNPKTQNILDKLNKVDREIKLFLCSSTSIEHGLERYDDQNDTEASKKGILDINPDTISLYVKKLTKTEDVGISIKEIRNANSARRVSETIEVLFAGALALGASDIHIEPEENGIRVRYRLDGVLQDIVDLQKFVYDRIMSRLKLLSGMILNQKQEAQDGRFTFTSNEREIEIRSSIIPGASGESIVMRLLDPTVAAFTLDKLGLNEQIHSLLKDQLKRPNGLIVTTGPTGSGKTTALYALLREAHSPERKIITIENPVEYKLEGIVQTQVGDDYNFATGLRAILRQDPDIIMVGEIRDSEVASTAVHAAQTGHLVFSTLHTNNAVGAFPRLIDIGVDPRMIGSSVNLVMAQRLIRVLCDKCKKERPASEKEMVVIKQILRTHPNPPKITDNLLSIFEPVGCEECNQSGFQGRAAVFEAIVVDEAVEEAVIRDPREHIISEAAIPQKIPTMAEDGIAKVIQGVTSLAELQRVVDLSNGRHTYPHSTQIENTETEKIQTSDSEVPDDDLLNSHIV